MTAPRHARSISTAVVTVMAAMACRSPQPQPPRPDPSAQLRREIAVAEAKRGGGIDELIAMTGANEALRANLALRALGRIGGAQVRARLLETVRCLPGMSTGEPDGASAGPAQNCRPGVGLTAAAALGTTAALDELPVGELGQISTALVAALAGAKTSAEQAVLIEALGRAGVEAAQPALASYLTQGGAAGEAAAIALGRHGRRGLAWSDDVRAQVVQTTTHRDTTLRYAATWALSREAMAPGAQAPISATVASALALRLTTDADIETRAVAGAALARRKLGSLAADAVATALGDADWRVAIEAMRAQATINDPVGADKIAAAMAARMRALAGDAGGLPGDSQVVVEALRQLATFGGRPQVAAELRAALIASEAVKVRAKVAAGWIRCLATAALERAEAAPDPGKLLGCGAGGLPEAYAAGVVAELVTAGVGAEPLRRAAVERLWAAKDPRVRAAALSSIAPSLVGVPPSSAAADLARLAEAVGSSEAFLAITSVETLARLWPETGIPAELDPAVRASLEAVGQAAISRGAGERDAELGAGILDFISARKLRSGEASCRAQTSNASPVIARAAARCLAALQGTPPATPGRPPAAMPPPVDVTLGVGAASRWRWKITTEHGVLEIDLDSAIAPWHVATIVNLTQRHFYDGLEFHRVVPNFVVQGGDPTQSGSGGPGFSLPSEPGSRLDADFYTAGATGFADGGRDSGGSQWFVMHSRAPHLEGRYTRVGQLVSGHDVVARLLVGDRVLAAQVIAR